MDLRSLETYFKTVDRDGNGLIDRAEFGSMLGALGLIRAGAVVDRAFGHLDSDGNGLIDLGEFIHWWQVEGASLPAEKSLQASLEKLRSSFRAKDQRGDGRIDLDGFRSVLADVGLQLSSPDLRLTLAQIQRQDSRYFTLDELVRWWLQRANQ